MSPRSFFSLDQEGHDRCAELLAAAGMEFVEQDREIFVPVEDPLRSVVRFGELISPRGVFEFELHISGGAYAFWITVTGDEDADILDDVSRAFAGHLNDETTKT